MNDFSSAHWFVVLFVLGAALVGIGYPVFRILGRMGLPRWWTLFALIPYANIIALWLVAFVRWPKVDGASPARDTLL